MLVKTLLPFIVAALAVTAAPLADAGKAPSKVHKQAPAPKGPAPALPAKLPIEPRKEVSKAKAAPKTHGSGSPLPVDPAAKLAAAKGNVPRDEGDDEEYEEPESEASAAKPKPKHKEPASPVDMLPAPAKQVVKMAPRAEDQVAKLKESQPDFRPTTHTTDAQSKKVSQSSPPTMMVYNVGHEKGTEAVQPLGLHVRGSKPAKRPAQDKSQAPPAQVVGAKDEVLSHAPRASKKDPQPLPAQAMGVKDEVLSHAPRDSKAAAPQLPPSQVVGAKDEVVSHVPRASKKDPQVPPAQVVGAKDQVLSHAPRAHNKNHKQTPLSTVEGTVEEKPKMVAGSAM